MVGAGWKQVWIAVVQAVGPCRLDLGPWLRFARADDADVMKERTRGWLADVLVGGIGGGVVGAVVAVNVVIYAGIEGGYEASIPDVFRQNALAGLGTVAILLAGPVLGVVVARRLRRRQVSRHAE